MIERGRERKHLCMYLCGWVGVGGGGGGEGGACVLYNKILHFGNVSSQARGGTPHSCDRTVGRGYCLSRSTKPRQHEIR